ncbi:outer membrane beta-barrel protein [Marinoscillum furvescens]|uniref:Putative OmpL-like beta-barrel porin-2 n=1 Tax=Marinoscillum furvescens DSM 4134 TaxID=1122208 RepID=A0A3D9L4Q0_MARFU|nr:outer membrane beta-barrel protein [Marinoscillum furvescens]RED99775.1 putative OmpL-like beta-barrel porin-2 [Marinoscillum furvescens DSM 4134]
MTRIISFIFISLLFLKFYNVNGQDSEMKFGFYLDTYYAYDFSKPTENQRLYVTQHDQHNAFQLNHGIIKGAYDGERVRGSLALQTGTYPANNYSAEPDKLYQMIYEGYAGVKVGKKGWVDVGIFGGHFGYESALAMDRALYSPALATEYTPYYQSGVRYTQPLSENTEIRAVVLNGWQNIGETNNNKAVGLAIDHRFGEQFMVSYGNYYGKENDGDSAVNRFHNNFLIELAPVNKLKIVAIADYTRQEVPNASDHHTTTFLTGIISYEVIDRWSLAGRYEYVVDQNALLLPAHVGEFIMNIASLTVSHQLNDAANFKLEGKLYRGPYDNFVGENGVGDATIVVSTGLMIKLGAL